MSNYLSQIAGRNMTVPASTLMPSPRPVASRDENPFELNTDDPAGFYSMQQNFSHNAADEQFQNPAGPKAQETGKKNTEYPVQTNYQDHTYITRHIERVEIKENEDHRTYVSLKNEVRNPSELHADRTPVKDQPAESKSGSATAASGAGNPGEAKKPENGSVQITSQSPGQKPVRHREEQVGLSSEYQPAKSIPRVQKNTPVTRLHPVQPGPVPVKRTDKKPAPKLVIGKITVEIVQPQKPVPPRVVHNVIPAPAVAGGAAKNKLSFGLGQL